MIDTAVYKLLRVSAWDWKMGLWTECLPRRHEDLSQTSASVGDGQVWQSAPARAPRTQPVADWLARLPEPVIQVRDLAGLSI